MTVPYFAHNNSFKLILLICSYCYYYDYYYCYCYNAYVAKYYSTSSTIVELLNYRISSRPVVAVEAVKKNILL